MRWSELGRSDRIGVSDGAANGGPGRERLQLWAAGCGAGSGLRLLTHSADRRWLSHSAAITHTQQQRDQGQSESNEVKTTSEERCSATDWMWTVLLTRVWLGLSVCPSARSAAALPALAACQLEHFASASSITAPS